MSYMEELQRRRSAVAAQAQKLDTELDHLIYQVEGFEDVEHPHQDAVKLALGAAKRVRRESNLVVQALAQLRDHLQPEEAQGSHE